MERHPNPLWESLCAAFGLKPVTRAECKRVGRIVADLKLKGAVPADIPWRIERYSKLWPKCVCTPEALLKHWDMLGANLPGVKPVEDRVERLRVQREKARRERAEALDFSEAVKRLKHSSQMSTGV